MDPEPESASRLSSPLEARSESYLQKEGTQDEDPFNLSATSIAFFGLIIAMAIVGVPLLAVFTERPLGKESLDSTAFQSNGSKFTSPFTFSWFGQSAR